MTGLQAFILGIAVTSLAYYIVDYISGYFDYRKFKKWLVTMDIDIRSIDEKGFDKYYAMWEISKLPNIEIKEVTEKDKDDVISREDRSK
jgi:hypothetical protein